MRASTCRITLPAAAIVGALILMPRPHAEQTDPAALAAAVARVPTTLQQGLQASEKNGKPISAKFEIEEGKLQLSVYTTTADGYNEVVVAPDSGNVLKAEKITDTEDIQHATGQKAAMEKASVSLIVATEHALQGNTGARAISIVPELKGGQPVASVMLLRNGQLSTVTEKLN